MNRFTAVALIVIASMQFSRVVYAQNSQATLEFCLAANAPAGKWTEHAVPNTDDVIFVSPKSVLTGHDIKKVSFSKDDKGHWTIGFTLPDEKGAKMWNATSQNIGKRLAILLDGKVVSAPTIRSGIKKEGAISGRFDNNDLLRLFTAIVLHDTSEKD